MRKRGYGRTYSVTVSRTVVRAANRTHFYGSGIWVNVPKGRYNTSLFTQTLLIDCELVMCALDDIGDNAIYFRK